MHLINAAFSADLDAERVPTLENDYFAHNYINKKFQAFDLELYKSKWFDYRFMTPLQATRAYIDQWGAIYRRIYAREFDRQTAEYIKPLDWDHIRRRLTQGDKKTSAHLAFTGCWRGRQIADALGMPYEIYIDLALTYRMRRWKQRHMPQPHHLYHEFDVEKVQNRWIELQSSSLYLAEHPAYMVQNYQGVESQNDYHEWLFAQAGKRSNPPELIARFIDEDRLPLDKVRARFDDDQFELVERYLQ